MFDISFRKTCLKKLTIYNQNITNHSANEGEAWAKGYPDSKKSLDLKTYNSDFNWFQLGLKTTSLK